MRKNNSKRALYESIMKNVAKQVKKALNESMIFPEEVDRVYWDGDESLKLLGTDGVYYDVYPTYGDAYDDGDDDLTDFTDVTDEVGFYFTREQIDCDGPRKVSRDALQYLKDDDIILA